MQAVRLRLVVLLRPCQKRFNELFELRNLLQLCESRAPVASELLLESSSAAQVRNFSGKALRCACAFWSRSRQRESELVASQAESKKFPWRKLSGLASNRMVGCFPRLF